MAIGVLLFIVVAVVTAVVASRYSAGESETSGSSAVSGLSTDITSKQRSEIIEKIERHILLPEEDEIVVVILRNTAQLQKDQNFYKGAQDGDYLMILPQNKKAIIYSSKLNKLVNVGPLITSAEDI